MGQPLAVDLLVERGAGDGLGPVRRLRQHELRAGRLQLGRGAGVGAALGRKRGVELRQPPLEVRGTAGSVGAYAIQLCAHTGEVRADRGQLALASAESLARTGMRGALARQVSAGELELPAGLCCGGLGRGRALPLRGQLGGRLRANGRGVRRRALAGESDLLGRLISRRERIGEAALGVGELVLERTGPALLVAQRGERDRIGSPQQLTPPDALPLIGELGPQALDGRDGGGERIRLPRVARRGDAVRRRRWRCGIE
jgi:hypothetical protein